MKLAIHATMDTQLVLNYMAFEMIPRVGLPFDWAHVAVNISDFVLDRIDFAGNFFPARHLENHDS